MIKHQTGSALITAILITAIVAAIATIMAVRQRVDIRETQLTVNADKAYLDLQGVQEWAIVTLAALKSQTTPLLPSTFPIIMPPTNNFYGAKVYGMITDQQGLFNINSLTSANNQVYLARLLSIVDPALNKDYINTVTEAVTEWLTSSNADDIYLKFKPPYRAAHQPMVSISELRLVAGVTPQIFQALKPYITALPTATNQINLNTAPAPILMMLNSELSYENAKLIIACRQQNIDVNICAKKVGITLSSTLTTLTSNYFLVSASIKLGSQSLNSYSLLYTTFNPQQQPIVQTLWQSYQTL